MYHLFKKDLKAAEKASSMTEEQNTHLLVRKYEEAIAQPYKLKANREFLMLQKILLRDAQKDNKTTGNDFQEICPIVNLEGTKRIEVYDDELTYFGPDTIIDLVQMSSEPHRNFLLVAMDNMVYKYDLVSKELLF